MKLTDAADRMIQHLGKIHTAEDMATLIGLAELIAEAQRFTRIATVHIEAARGTIWEARQPHSIEALVNPERCEECRGFARYEIIVGGLAHYYCDECLPATDPMAPDYTALAAEEPTGQNGDGRDAAEIPGAQ